MGERWRIPLSDLNVDAAEEAALIEAFRSRWWSMGPRVEAFEHAFAEFLGVKHAVAVSSATAALHLAWLALDLAPGDEVVQPALNFAAAANTTRLVGGRAVFADIVSTEEPTLDPADVESALTKRTRAVVVMAYGGMAPRMAELRELCDRRGVALIEDACHALAAVADGKKIGTWGEISAFSFFPNKNMTTAEGGMAATDDDALAERLRRLRSHGMTAPTWARHTGGARGYDVVEPGLNYRLDELRAAIGLVQLGKLRDANSARAERAAWYDELLSGLREEAWEFPGGPPRFERSRSACHIYPVLVPGGLDAEELIDRLAGRGIQTSRHYTPVHQFSGYQAAARPLRRTEEFARRQVTLPLWPGMTREQVEEVAAEVLAWAKSS